MFYKSLRLNQINFSQARTTSVFRSAAIAELFKGGFEALVRTEYGVAFIQRVNLLQFYVKWWPKGKNE
jgi:hypothetical protein